MSAEDILNDEFMVLEEETMKVAEEVAAYQRKLMAPIWEKRSAMVKKVPGFWGQAIGNSPLFGISPSDNDVEALDNLTDFHVEYDHTKPNYRKVVATFKKNDIFKNTTLTKEFSIDPEDNDGNVISKTTIEYHEDKAPKKEKTEDNEEDDDVTISFIEWFGDDDVRPGVIISEDIFPNAVDYYQGPGEDFDIDEDEEIELGSEDESDDEEEVPQKKRARK